MKNHIRKRFHNTLYIIMTVVICMGLSTSLSTSLAESDIDLPFDGGPGEVFGDMDAGFDAGAESGTDLTDIEEVSNDELKLVGTKPWAPPNYTQQDSALGWTAETFNVPDGLMPRVDFWKMIYTKYSSQEGVFHDIEDVTRIYSYLDLRHGISEDLPARSKQKTKKKLMNSKRQEIQDRLLRLAKFAKISDLKDKLDQTYFNLFTPLSPEEILKKENKKALSDFRNLLKQAAKKKRIRFQHGQRDKFILGIIYSGRYLNQMEKMFHEEGLPKELTRLPFVESSFNIKAKSRVGASGIWQFMRRTAKPWMLVRSEVDERNDPLTATRAAAKLLRANFERLGNWPLAVTAYNHGVNGLARAVKKTKTSDLMTIIEKYDGRRFGFASSNFYACFLAALDIESHAAQFFSDHELKRENEFNGVEIRIKKPIAWQLVVDFFNGNYELAELQNPHMNASVIQGKKLVPIKTFVRIPKSAESPAVKYLNGDIAEDELNQQIRKASPEAL